MRPRIVGTRQRGIVLVAVVLALALIGTLVVGAYAAALRSTRGGQLRYRQTEALAASEYGAERELSRLKATPPSGMAVGQTFASVNGWIVGDATVDVSLTRIGDSARELYLIHSSARAGGGAGLGAARGVSILAEISSPTFNILGGLTTAGGVLISGGASITGADSAPPGWSCPANAGAALPGIAAPPGASVATASCSAATCVSGSPPVTQTPLAADSMTYRRFGDLDWAALVSRAKRVPPVVSPAPSFTMASCAMADPVNWGDPARSASASPCESYFPLLYAPGDLDLAGGTGQGILLVDGDLTVSGGARFYGVVIVQGGIHATGTGGAIWGAALSAPGGSAPNSLSAPLAIGYSSCAVAGASSAQRIPGRVPGRPWVEAY
jgi:hypothetical protein